MLIFFSRSLSQYTPAWVFIATTPSPAFAALAIMAVSDWIKTGLIADVMPSFPTILIVTTLALILAQFRFMRRLQGAFEIGNLSFYLFFCAVGAMINVKMAIILSPILFLYVLVMIVVHMAMMAAVIGGPNQDAVSQGAGPPESEEPFQCRARHIGLVRPQAVVAPCNGHAIEV